MFGLHLPVPRLIRVITATWATTLLAGFLVVAHESGQPGRPAAAPLRQAVAADRRLQLDVFAHPHCPCTRATLAELERLMALADGCVHCRVVLVHPPGVPASWSDTPLAERARAIPGVTVIDDRGGELARDRQVHTSGQALLYAADGRLLFAGGITPSRAHEGPNAGRDAILRAIQGERPGVADFPVFGCPLLDSDSAHVEAACCRR